jgi:hypothetical protein
MSPLAPAKQSKYAIFMRAHFLSGDHPTLQVVEMGLRDLLTSLACSVM